MASQRSENWSRRKFVQSSTGALVAGAAAWGGTSTLAVAAEAIRPKISDVQTMTMQGPGRNYVYVRILTSDGHSGIGEGYGTPGVGVAQQIMEIKPYLVGKNPLEIEKLYTLLDTGAKDLSGTRTDGSAHNFMRAASAIDMALWDLAGNVLNTPTSVLLGGQYRDHVRVYDHSRPDDFFDKGALNEWAAKVKAHPSGFTAHKVDLPRTSSIWSTGKPRRDAVPDATRSLNTEELSTRELIRIGQAYENMRDALGWDHDLMVHCHWEFDLPTAIKIAEATAPAKPLWLEDPLGVDYSESWKLLTARSPVPILTGENLTRVEGFAPFIINDGCNIMNPDLRNSGGLSETRRIAELADQYGMPISTHGTASQVCTYAVAQWGSAIHNYMIGECITGEGGWMDQVLKLDGPYIEKGYIKVSDKPGLGLALNREVVEAHLATGEKWWGDV
jgi:L-alanine-DL-glutamate epimerase-like enolase superfamily enzyme